MSRRNAMSWLTLVLGLVLFLAVVSVTGTWDHLVQFVPVPAENDCRLSRSEYLAQVQEVYERYVLLEQYPEELVMDPAGWNNPAGATRLHNGLVTFALALEANGRFLNALRPPTEYENLHRDLVGLALGYDEFCQFLRDEFRLRLPSAAPIEPSSPERLRSELAKVVRQREQVGKRLDELYGGSILPAPEFVPLPSGA